MNKQEVFANVLSKYKDEVDYHLDAMSVDELCEHRQSISKQLRSLEEERRAIDDELMEYLSEEELRRGVKLKSGSSLKMRARTNWKYPDEIVMKISDLRRHSREVGEAFSETTSYLVIT